MKFIYIFNNNLKIELLNRGYKLLSDNSNFFIFENNMILNFNFSDIDKKQFYFSDKLIF